MLLKKNCLFFLKWMLLPSWWDLTSVFVNLVISKFHCFKCLFSLLHCNIFFFAVNRKIYYRGLTKWCLYTYLCKSTINITSRHVVGIISKYLVQSARPKYLYVINCTYAITNTYVYWYLHYNDVFITK